MITQNRPKSHSQRLHHIGLHPIASNLVYNKAPRARATQRSRSCQYTDDPGRVPWSGHNATQHKAPWARATQCNRSLNRSALASAAARAPAAAAAAAAGPLIRSSHPGAARPDPTRWQVRSVPCPVAPAVPYCVALRGVVPRGAVLCRAARCCAGHGADESSVPPPPPDPQRDAAQAGPIRVTIRVTIRATIRVAKGAHDGRCSEAGPLRRRRP